MRLKKNYRIEGVYLVNKLILEIVRICLESQKKGFLTEFSYCFADEKYFFDVLVFANRDDYNEWQNSDRWDRPLFHYSVFFTDQDYSDLTDLQIQLQALLGAYND